MTVDELIDWLESAKRIADQSGQRIAEYEILTQDSRLFEPKVDHGQSAVFLMVVQ